MDFIKDRILGIIDGLPDFDSDAVLYAFIAGLITGWVWYAIAGQVWKASVASATGINSPRRYIFSAIAQIIMTIMLAITIRRLGETTIGGAIETAFVIWLGFVMTTILVNYSNLGAKLALTIIDGVHWLLVLLVMATVIGAVSDFPAPVTVPAAPAATDGGTGSDGTSGGASSGG
ncbi:MAG: DUF1761 domain-containing protein [Hyphomicrobiaceae bacterium]